MKLDLKIYRSYANEREIVVMGHLFKKHAPDVYNLDKSWYKHAWAVIRMFTIKTIKNAEVTFLYDDMEVTSKTLDDGHFRLTIPYKKNINSGWHEFKIKANVEGNSRVERGEFVKPYPGEYGVISDIDDTFLVSHSGNIFKKLYVMLTKNIDKRNVFDEAVDHYQLLNTLGRKNRDKNNAFFYVSSSEWNLYNFIIQFTKMHELPKAVLKLKNIKSGIADFLFTGGGSHNHKFFKIKHLVEFYPELRFILLGDDSQKDVYIYQDICKIFPENVSTIYIRQTKDKKKKVEAVLDNIASMGVKVCYFKKSDEAIAHTEEHLG